MRGKSSWLRVIVGFGLLFAAYAATRLTNLTSLPIFTDEAIYIRWSQIGAQDAAWRFISLTDGKQPMFTWVMMILLRILRGSDPLFVGRVTSVIAGFGTLIGLWFLSYELFRDKKIAWLSSVIYLVLPFSAWYDRMALYDSLVATFSVWSLYVAVLLATHIRLDTALILGFVMGAGMLNKSSGFLTLYFLPVTLLVFDWKMKSRWRRLFRWAFFVMLAALLSQVFYSILRLSPFFHIIGQKDNVFVFSLSEWFDQPFRFFAGNLRGMFDWLRSYMTVPLFFAAFASLFTRWSKTRERMLLFFWWILPFAALANFGKVLYPRFILFMTMPLLPLASDTLLHMLGTVRRPFIRIVLILIFFIPSLSLTSMIVFRPVMAPIPFADRGQFIDDWPAGGGVREVVTFLRSESADHNISVYTEGTFGLMPYALEIYLVDRSNVRITGLWPIPPVMPEAIAQDATQVPTFFVMNARQEAPLGWPLTLIGEYKKGNSPQDTKLRLYRVRVPSTVAL